MEEILKKIEEQDRKIDAIFISVEKTRKYFQWTLIITIATVVLPVLAVAALLPWFLRTMTSAYSGLGM